MSEPLIKFTSPQEEVFWATHRILFLLWRRQFGKSFLFGAKAISRMMQIRQHSAFVLSASIQMAQENILKEAAVWEILLNHYRKLAESQGLLLKSNADGLALDDIAELFEASKLEAKLWHSNSVFSRTRVVAPNPQTARGYSGDIFGDEFGFWEDFDGVMDAIEPIISRRPDWIMWMATTPPKDDTHPSYELLDPGEIKFPVNARGNWFKTENGTPVHRVDAYDGDAAGVSMFHPLTGATVSVDEARAAAMNKVNFDRNYLLKFLASGSSAIPRHLITAAQAKGNGSCRGIDITDQLYAA